MLDGSMYTLQILLAWHPIASAIISSYVVLTLGLAHGVSELGSDRLATGDQEKISG